MARNQWKAGRFLGRGALAGIERCRKFVAAERRDQRAERARSPEFAALALWIFVALAMGGSAFAKGDEPPRRSATVIVPYDPAKPVAGQKPDQFYLPYEHFLQLWEAAKQNRAGVKAEPAAVPFALSAARYEGVVGERSVAFTGKLDVTTYNDAWVKVPLAFKDVQIGALKIDGVAAAYDGGEIIVEKPGRHTIEVSFEIPLRRGAKVFAFGVPRTGATLVALRLRDPRMRAVIAPGSGTVERLADGVKTVTAAVGAADLVQVTLESGDEVTRVTEPAVANFGPWVTVTPTLETTRAAYTFSFPKARQDRFTVYFENGLTLTGLEARDLKSWKLTASAERQALEIVLNEAAQDEYAFSITCERPMPKLPADLRAPVFSAAAKRLEGGIALFAGAGVELVAKPSAALRQAPLTPPSNGWGRLIAAYEGTGELAYRAALAEARREARVDYAYQVNRRKIELIASLQLFAKGDDLRAMTLSVPAQFEVQAVQSERLQDWWREGDALHLRFRGETPEMTPLVVYLVRQYAAAPTEIDVRPLTLDGFKRVSGEAVIAAHKGVEVKLKLADGTEIAPEKAATDFQILPPLERKRGFTFKEQKFAAQVALAALPAKTHALWVMNAQAHEGWVAVSIHPRLTLRQGSIDRAEFALPAGVPEARVTGSEVRETRSRVEGDRRIYEVQFQNDVYESVEFTADLELPNPGEVALPAVTFPGAQMTSGFVLTDNASEFEMKVKTSGTDPAPVSEIPFLPELSKAAGIYRVQPDWKVTVGIERLEKAATRAAFVAWAEMTTALRRDGTEWHRATYRLQNRSLQFLPVRLPAGAELMSVRVAGQSVRADAGKVNGREALLVPLIKTKPGDLSYDVELVYRLKGAALDWRATQDFRDPELPGITVERTLWNVWLPDDRKLSKSDGNMEAVLGDLNKTEKIESKLQELKALAAIASSEKVSAATRENAMRNWGLLCAEIRMENRDVNFEETNSYVRGGAGKPTPTPTEDSVGKKGIAQQFKYVEGKRQALNEELGREAEKFAQLEKQGAGNLNRGNANTFTGNTNINAGVLNPGGQNAQSGNALNNAGEQTQTLDGTNTYTGATVVNQPGQLWGANSFFAAPKPAATPEPEKTAPNTVGNSVYFNDNIVLQQKVAPKAAAGKGGGKGEGKPGSEVMPTKDQGDRQEEKGDKGQADTILNSARSNPALMKMQQGQMAQQQSPLNNAGPAPSAPPNSQLQPNAPAGPGGVPGNATPNPVVNQPLGGVNTYTGTTTVNAGGVLTNGVSPEDEAQRMQTTGRISLAVDFPTEGQVLHFKKVKANAHLELTTSTPETWVRWKFLALALVLAGALAALRRWVEKRGRQRVAVGA